MSRSAVTAQLRKSGREEASSPQPHNHRDAHKGLRRAFRLLDLIGHDPGLDAAELAIELGISRSTAYWLLSYLGDEGYIERREDRGYRLGPAIDVHYERRSRQGIDTGAIRALHEVAHSVSRHAHLVTLAGGHAVVLAVAAPSLAPPIGLTAGLRGPTHALAAGKMLLAVAGPQAIGDYLASGALEAFTSNTVISPARLELQLKDTARRGFAVDVEEFAANLCSVAVPIGCPPHGCGTVALGLATTRPRFPSEASFLLRLLREAARTMQQEPRRPVVGRAISAVSGEAEIRRWFATGSDKFLAPEGTAP